MKRQLDRLFHPKSIAVIGASNQEGKVGYLTYMNLKLSGFKGKLYAINLKHRIIQGDLSHQRIGDIPAVIDLAIIATPANTVVQLVEECGKAKVGGVVILTAGFKEAGKIGQSILNDINRLARQYQIRVLGPNSLGFINNNIQLNASFAQQKVKTGKLAFITQSGALATAILDWSANQSIGFTFFISSGSMINVDFHDLIDYCAMDNQTACILIYMESIVDARRFMSASRNFARSKPIIILKSGSSLEGAQAAFSHTGRLAGNDLVYSAAFQRAGIIRVDRIATLFHCAQAFATQPRLRGNRLAIITNAGAAGVMATDYLCKNEGQLAQIPDDIIKKLDTFLHVGWSQSNPIDLLGEATANEFKQTLRICSKCQEIDGFLVILTPQYASNPTAIASAVLEVAKKIDKPLLTVWMGEDAVEEGRNLLDRNGVPCYRYPESAVDTWIKMYEYTYNIDLLYQTPPASPEQFQPEYEKAKALIVQLIQERRAQPSPEEVKQLLTYYDIQVTPFRMVYDEAQVQLAAELLGFPVALKIVSPDIIRKSDVGGVQLNIQNSDELLRAYRQMLEAINQNQPNAKIEGIMVEKMMRKRHELIIGAKTDPDFGPVITFGKGGVTVEVFQDLSVGLPPLNMMLAQRLIEQTKSYEVLKGYRAYPAVDLEQLKFTLCKFSYLLMDFPAIQEIEINPFTTDETGSVALDGFIQLNLEQPIASRYDYPHLAISPYPSQYIKTISLKNGKLALLRPILAEDEPLEAELFDYLSENTIYFRFFGYRPKLTHDLLTRFTHIDYDREMAIVAEVEVEGKKRLAGVVRIIADAWNETAEYAIVIADDFQGQGLGKALTSYILEIAKEKGIRKVFASVLATNKRMLNMFKSRGFDLQREDFQTFYVEKLL